MRVAMPIFDRLTVLDAIGPYEVLSRLPDTTVHFLAADGSPGPRRTENGMLAVNADLSLDELPDPEIVVMPGGYGTRALLTHEGLLGWLRAADASSTWTTSVCTGSLLLGAAGLLTGKRATTHWMLVEQLAQFGATPVRDERIVEQGKLITAAGVSAGIDMALLLAARIAGDDVAQAIQLGIEYDPAPPFPGGSVTNSRPEIIELVRRRSEQFT
jgi:transcriptional regulator GlxA family with amidase domain